MDRVTFDFENDKVIFDTDAQKGVESCPDLKSKKAAIMAAAGYETIPMQDFKSELQDRIKRLLDSQEE